jgi:hypothetical protein
MYPLVSGCILLYPHFNVGEGVGAGVERMKELVERRAELVRITVPTATHVSEGQQTGLGGCWVRHFGSDVPQVTPNPFGAILGPRAA